MEPAKQPVSPEKPESPIKSETVVQPSQEFVKELQATQPAEPTQPAAPVENSPVVEQPQPATESSADFAYHTMSASPLTEGGEGQSGTGNPKILYALGALVLIVAILTFFFASSTVTSLGAIVDLAVGVGLILRKEAFRKITVILIAINLVLSVIGFFGFVAVKSASDNKASQALSALETLKTNPANQDSYHMQNIANLENSVNTKQAKLQQTYNRLYLSYGLGFFISTSILIYLTRPKVKKLFS